MPEMVDDGIEQDLCLWVVIMGLRCRRPDRDHQFTPVEAEITEDRWVWGESRNVDIFLYSRIFENSTAVDFHCLVWDDFRKDQPSRFDQLDELIIQNNHRGNPQ